MASFKKNPNEIPEDAILLTEDEAAVFNLKIIENWDNFSDVWAFRAAPGILGGLSALSGIYINNFYRTRLKLGNYGRLSTYLPIVALPAIMSSVYHRSFTQKSIILREDICPVCTEIRATSFQSLFGVIYPMILAPLASFMNAARYYTYRLPHITENPREVFHIYRKMTKSLVPGLITLLIINNLACMFLTYKEMENVYNIYEKIAAIEKEAERSNNISEDQKSNSQQL